MSLRMLIVHEFKVMRQIVEKYSLAEMAEAEVESVASSREAVERLAAQKYDIVLCALEMAGLDGLGVRDKMRASPLNQNTPFVILTSTDTEAQQRRLAEQGVEHALIIPFSALELRGMVTHLTNLRQRRSHARFNIPGAMAEIHFGQNHISAEVVNISLNGLLCNLTYPEKEPNLLEACQITVNFPPDYGQARAADIIGSLVRLNVLSWRGDHSPEQLRAAWKFVDTPPAAAKTLEMTLETARRDLMLAEERARGGPKDSAAS